LNIFMKIDLSEFIFKCIIFIDKFKIEYTRNKNYFYE